MAGHLLDIRQSYERRGSCQSRRPDNSPFHSECRQSVTDRRKPPSVRLPRRKTHLGVLNVKDRKYVGQEGHAEDVRGHFLVVDGNEAQLARRVTLVLLQEVLWREVDRLVAEFDADVGDLGIAGRIVRHRPALVRGRRVKLRKDLLCESLKPLARTLFWGLKRGNVVFTPRRR
jgi:hypothetical protein